MGATPLQNLRRGQRLKLWPLVLGTLLVAASLFTDIGIGRTQAWAQTADSSAPRPDSTQPYLDRVASAVSEFTLDNGMRFLVLERHQAPVVSMAVRS